MPPLGCTNGWLRGVRKLQTTASIATSTSIKGASGFLEFHRLEKLTHAGENLLDALRSSEIVMREEIASALLELNDAVRQMLGIIETTGSDEGADDPSFEELRLRLEQLLAEGTGSAAVTEDSTAPKTPAASEATAQNLCLHGESVLVLQRCEEFRWE